MSGEKNLKKLIASITPVLSEHEYVFCTLTCLDSKQLSLLQPISTFQEPEGLTLILKKETADKSKLDYSGSFKCITLNVHSSLEAVGLTAVVSTKLAKANISANVVAAFFHDHLFVPLKDAQEALLVLNDL